MNVNHQLLDKLQMLGQERKPVERLYARMLDEKLFATAYTNLYANQGAMTVGTDPTDSIDGMSMARIRDIIQTLHNNEWEWKPTRRIYIDKSDGRKRPLSIPGWTDKLVQEVMRMVLEAYYEPIFREVSHGFRPNRSCHTALMQIRQEWTGVKWFIEGDIKGCFDNIDHTLLLASIGQRIRDFRFLKLLRTLLKAGYMELGHQQATLSGVPQGGVISPILSNIFMHDLDKYVTQKLIPNFDKGKRRRPDPDYHKLTWKLRQARLKDDKVLAKELTTQMKKLPSRDNFDPNYRRLLYIRYADDFLIGVIGTKQEAEEIKQKVGNRLAEMKLPMSQEKTKVTHATLERAHFLGYDIYRTSRKDSLRLNGTIQLSVPKATVQKLLARYTRNGKGYHRTQYTSMPEEEIIKIFDLELRGYYNYFKLAFDVSNKIGHVQYFMWQSLVKTLAHKQKVSVAEIVRRYRPKTAQYKRVIAITRENNKGKPVTFTFGDFSLKREHISRDAKETDPYIPALQIRELTRRILQTTCELCGKPATNLEVHHIRRMKDIRRKVDAGQVPAWMLAMHSRNRKTLVVCKDCHQQIHQGTRTRRAG